MFNRLLKLVLALGYAVGLWFYRLFASQNGQLLVLCYHEITDEQKNRFAHQLEIIIQRGIRVVPANTTRLTSGALQIAITFDDGFENLLKNAIPLLKQNHQPATLFIPFFCLGKYPSWLTTTHHPNKHEKLMTQQQLKAIASDGISIGSHGLNHLDLTRTDVDVGYELKKSKQYLEEFLEVPIDLLAYPYGRSNEVVHLLAKQAGFKRVFNSDPISNEDDFLMGRVNCSPNDWTIEFKLKIYGAYQWLPYLIRLKAKIKGMLRVRNRN